MGSWLAAIAALPKIIDAGLKLVQFFEQRFGPAWEQKIDQIFEAHQQLEKATTDEERLKALRAIVASRKL